MPSSGGNQIRILLMSAESLQKMDKRGQTGQYTLWFSKNSNTVTAVKAAVSFCQEKELREEMLNFKIPASNNCTVFTKIE